MPLAERTPNDEPAARDGADAPIGAPIGADPRPRRRREHFIPLPACQIVELLAGELDPTRSERDKFLNVSRLLESALHQDYHDRLKRLKQSYAPFDPDDDACATNDLTAKQRPSADADSTPQADSAADIDAAPSDVERRRRAHELVSQIVGLLQRANYVRLDRADMHRALQAASEWGVNLRVDFDSFEQLELFARGDSTSRRTRRRWRGWDGWRSTREVDVPIYQRLVLIFRLRADRRPDANVSSTSVHVKLFKNIPQCDLEMLLPGAQVRMTWLDQGKILLPTLSGLGLTVWKAVQGALILVFAGLKGALAFLALIGGTFGYALRSVFGYVNTRNRYQLNLTRSLYYQNLANNGGVLFRLLDEAEEQDYREMLLAYFLLWREAGGSGWTPAQLDEAVERRMRGWLDLHVDFEVHDALEKLLAFGLVVALPGERYRATSLHEAQSSLEARLVRGLAAESQRGGTRAPHFRPTAWSRFKAGLTSQGEA